MKKLIVVLLLLWSGVSYAGTVTMTVTTASGACSPSCTKTYTDTDANLSKIITTYQGQCNAKVGGTCTALQVVNFWFDSIVALTVSNVGGFEKGNLSNTATSGYVPINPQ